MKWATDRRFKNVYDEEECLIIGGGYRGPKGEYERFEGLDKYPGKVIACNSGYKVRDVNILAFKDEVFVKQYKDELKELNCLKFWVDPCDGYDDIDYWAVPKDVLPRCSYSFLQGINGYLGGWCALNVAIILGFRKIYLTGFSGGPPEINYNSTYFVFFTEVFNDTKQEIYVTEKNSILKDIFSYGRPKGI